MISALLFTFWQFAQITPWMSNTLEHQPTVCGGSSLAPALNPPLGYFHKTEDCIKYILLTNLNDIFQMLAACGPQAWSPLIISLAMDLSSQALHTGVSAWAKHPVYFSPTILIPKFKHAYMLLMQNIMLILHSASWSITSTSFQSVK